MNPLTFKRCAKAALFFNLVLMQYYFRVSFFVKLLRDESPLCIFKSETRLKS